MIQKAILFWGVLCFLSSWGWAASDVMQRDWVEVDSPHFHIYSDGSESAARTLANDLEQFAFFAGLITGIEPKGAHTQFQVFSINDPALLDELTQSAHGDTLFHTGLQGSYAIIPGQPVAAADLGEAPNGVLQLRHEYVRYLLRSRARYVYPVWYEVGLAEFLATLVPLDARKVELGRPPAFRLAAMQEHGWIPAQDLIRADHDKAVLFSDSFYGYSWLLTYYLMTDEKRQQDLTAYLQAYNAGSTASRSFEKGFGVQAKYFNMKWASDTKQLDKSGYAFVDLSFKQRYETPEINAAKAAPADVALALAELYASNNNAASLLASLLRSAEPARGNTGDWLLLQAELLVQNGSPREAVERLTQADASLTDAAEYHTALGDAYAAAATQAHDNNEQDWKELLTQARNSYVKAVQLNKQSADSYWGLGHTFLKWGDSDRYAHGAFMGAYNNAPQNMSLNYYYAVAAHKLGERDKAMMLLNRVVATDNEALFDKAVALRERLE